MFYNFLENEQFNFQINRMVGYGEKAANLDEVWNVVAKVKDMETWYEEWSSIAKKAENEHRFLHAACYYRLAEFYLTDDRKEKLESYHKFKENFYKGIGKETLEQFKIPYEDTYLPALRVKAKEEKGIIVIHGGYDSFIEEFYLGLTTFLENGYTIICFEGPGQGQARKNGLPFCYNWEKPTTAVIDYFELNDITLIGISWGGYLCLRAAAFDKRIKNVICWNIFYSGLDMITMRMPSDVKNKFIHLLEIEDSENINKIFYKQMNESIDLCWKINHGMYITGTKTPFEYFKSIKNHTMNGIEDRITQNVLLLAGEKDQYVPIKRMSDLKNNLINTKSITARIFTEKEGGEQHGQVGNIDLAINEILNFLKNVR